jgi:myo-inositol-1(or 4)-monophosphatase
MNISTAEIFPRLAVARQAAQAAGQVLLELADNFKVENKQETYNLVTDADIRAEETICKIIRDNCPGDTLFREEGDSSGKLDDDHLWIIDPLDGTNNYAHTFPHYCVSIAFASQSQLLIGVIYDPNRDEMFWSMKNPGGDPTNQNGSPAFLNERMIETSSNAEIKDCIVSTGFYYDRGEMMKQTLSATQRLFEAQVQGIRRTGSAALDIAWVACGRLDAHFEYQLQPWDYGAASLILESAGGSCFDRNGDTLQLGSGNIIATNGKNSAAILDIVRWPTAES